MFRSVAIVTGPAGASAMRRKFVWRATFPLSRRRAHRRNAGGLQTCGEKAQNRWRLLSTHVDRLAVPRPSRHRFRPPQFTAEIVGAPFRGVGEQW
jgi:hypothetical protein